MNRKLILGICVFLFSFQSLAKIYQKHGLKQSEVSFFVYKKEKGIWISKAEQNLKQMRTPASLSKLFTAGAILENESFHENIKSRFTVDQLSLSDGALKKPLYFIGGGDPVFVSEKLFMLVQGLNKWGIKKIQGPIIVDSTYFIKTDGGTRTTDNERAYSAYTSAASFNWNTVTLEAFYPEPFFAPKLTTPAHVKDLKMSSNLETGRRTQVHVTGNSDQGFAMSGKVKKGDSKKVYRRVRNPDIWLGQNIIHLLENSGIQVLDKRVLLKKAPTNGVVLSEVGVDSNSDLINPLMKYSNNFIAEMLAQGLSVQSGGKGRVTHGVQLIKAHTGRYGIGSDKLHFLSPSGLNKNNKVTMGSLKDYLIRVRDKSSFFPEFLAALPVSGRDGTLKTRMKKAPFKIRGKTGLLNGVAGLAGYANSDASIVFGVVVNASSGKQFKAMNFIDEWAVKELSKWVKPY